MNTIIPFVLVFTIFGTDFDTPVDSWWCYLAGVCYLLARLLDEMDGK